MILLFCFSFISRVFCSCCLLLHLYWPQVGYYTRSKNTTRKNTRTCKLVRKLMSDTTILFHSVCGFSMQLSSTRSKQKHILLATSGQVQGSCRENISMDTGFKYKRGTFFKIWETVVIGYVNNNNKKGFLISLSTIV